MVANSDCEGDGSESSSGEDECSDSDSYDYGFADGENAKYSYQIFQSNFLPTNEHADQSDEHSSEQALCLLCGC